MILGFISNGGFHLASATSAVLLVPDQYLTIQSAINAAHNGDTILVGPGRYYEVVYVNKSVSIIGDSPLTTTIYGTGYQTNGPGDPFAISANNVLVANFSIRQGDEYNGAIRAISSSNVTVRNNVFVQIAEPYLDVRMDDCSTFSIYGNNMSNGGFIQIMNSQEGEISNNTLAGSNSGPIDIYQSSNIQISDNSILQTDIGITVQNSPNCSILRNTIGNSQNGLDLTKSPESILKDNVVFNSYTGISISECPGALLKNNSISNCKYNFGALGYTAEDYAMDIDTSNTVNGKPIYYLENQNGEIINSSTYPNIGYLALINSRNVTVEGLSLSNNLYGILLANTVDSTVKDNNLTSNDNAIYLSDESEQNIISFNQIYSYETGVRAFYSDNNQIIGNNITGGQQAIWLESSNGNAVIGNNISGNYESLHLLNTSYDAIYHNDFFDNTLESQTWGAVGTWNITYPSGGNYWQEYRGPDLYKGPSQGQPGSDGIIDSAYVSWDQYPLVGPVQTFDLGVTNGHQLYLQLISNSTATSIMIAPNEVSFEGSGTAGSGFALIALPNTFVQNKWNNNYTVLVNGAPQPYTTSADDQNTYVYVSYQNKLPTPTPVATSPPTQILTSPSPATTQTSTPTPAESPTKPSPTMTSTPVQPKSQTSIPIWFYLAIVTLFAIVAALLCVIVIVLRRGTKKI